MVLSLQICYIKVFDETNLPFNEQKWVVPWPVTSLNWDFAVFTSKNYTKTIGCLKLSGHHNEKYLYFIFIFINNHQFLLYLWWIISLINVILWIQHWHHPKIMSLKTPVNHLHLLDLSYKKIHQFMNSLHFWFTKQLLSSVYLSTENAANWQYSNTQLAYLD